MNDMTAEEAALVNAAWRKLGLEETTPRAKRDMLRWIREAREYGEDLITDFGGGVSFSDLGA